MNQVVSYLAIRKATAKAVQIGQYFIGQKEVRTKSLAKEQSQQKKRKITSDSSTFFWGGGVFRFITHIISLVLTRKFQNVR